MRYGYYIQQEHGADFRLCATNSSLEFLKRWSQEDVASGRAVDWRILPLGPSPARSLPNASISPARSPS